MGNGSDNIVTNPVVQSLSISLIHSQTFLHAQFAE